MAKNTLFNSIRVRRPKKNVFDLSRNNLSTMKMGVLYPTLCEEMVPGDRFKLNVNTFARAHALINPAYVNVKITNHFFFVPYQLLWSGWPDFLSGGKDGKTFREKPYASQVTQVYKGRLVDYLNFPTDIEDESVYFPKLDMMPIKAYHKIWNDYYRDQNLEEEVDILPNEDGNVYDFENKFNTVYNVLHTRNYTHDYFTSCLPWPQKGADVTIPVSGQSEIVGDGQMKFAQTTSLLEPAAGDINVDSSGNLRDSSNDAIQYDKGLKLSDSEDPHRIDIEDLRNASRLQRFAEKLARGGSRYFEVLHSIFGIRPTDETLQRPQYLGGGIQNVLVSEVVQSSEGGTSEDSTPLGTQGGKMISAGSSNNINFLAKEYGIIMCITSIMPTTGYFQGLPRKYNKWSRFDHYVPDFDNLGEQAVLNSEIYHSRDEDTDNTEFGYIPRYAEYKSALDEVHGELRGDFKSWHLFRNFSETPTLSKEFINCDPAAQGLDRIFAIDQDVADPFIVNLRFNIKAIRPMSRYSTPML